MIELLLLKFKSFNNHKSKCYNDFDSLICIHNFFFVQAFKNDLLNSSTQTKLINKDFLAGIGGVVEAQGVSTRLFICLALCNLAHTHIMSLKL